jgi:Uma2 family endonuclease
VPFRPRMREAARARATPPAPWTVEEFLAWEREQEDRYEYVGGVIRMMVGGTLDHNTIAGNVFSALRAQLRGSPYRAFIEGAKVTSDTATMYPDVVVTCAAGSGQSDVVPGPEIVVEVLSRSTQTFDRGAKLDAYQQIASLKQYVLVAGDEVRVSVYEQDDGGWRYHTLQDLDACLTFAIGDAAMTLAEIYERATVAEPGGAAADRSDNSQREAKWPFIRI